MYMRVLGATACSIVALILSSCGGSTSSSEGMLGEIPAYYEKQGLDGFENWFTIQAKEEMDHAMLIMQYMQNIDMEVNLLPIAKPDKVLDSDMGVLKAGLEHEEYVTSLINDIYAVAYEQKDFRTMQFLDWFVKEQGEEETNANDLITKMELFGSDPKSLYMLNQELGARIYSAPSLVL